MDEYDNLASKFAPLIMGFAAVEEGFRPEFGYMRRGRALYGKWAEISM